MRNRKRLRSMQCHIRVPVRVRPLQWPLQNQIPDSIDKDRKTKHPYDNAKYIAGFMFTSPLANEGINQQGQSGRNEKNASAIPRLVEGGVRLKIYFNSVRTFH
jgi:hypothetical protein